MTSAKSSLSRRIKDAVAKLFRSRGSTRIGGHRHKLKRSKMKVRSSSPNLNFSVGSTWAWSLKVVADGRALGIIQAASPLLCLTILEPYFAKGKEPIAPYKLLLCCNRNHRQLKLDRHSFSHLNGASAAQPAPELLAYLSDHFDLNLDDAVDAACITVMTNGEGDVVDSVALLHRVFDLERPRAEPQTDVS